MKTKLTLSVLSIFAVLILSSYSYNITNQNNETYSDFCEGWDDGYQAALDGCLKIGMTPICPIAPIGKDSYKHGYGMGYRKGSMKCD